MIRPGTFERVYAAIKEQLRRGRFRPGDRLEPTTLADELFASVTPIRDALHRLTGERLVETPRHDGFRVPQLSEASLRHLYSWHQDLLLLAIAHHHWAEHDMGSRLPDSAEPIHQRLNALFLDLARSTGNPEHVLALQSLIERLEPVQQIELLLLEAIEAESETIYAAVAAANRRVLRQALIRYHRRRLRAVPALLERLLES